MNREDMIRILKDKPKHKCIYCGKEFYSIYNLFKHNEFCDYSSKFEFEKLRKDEKEDFNLYTEEHIDI